MNFYKNYTIRKLTGVFLCFSLLLLTKGFSMEKAVNEKFYYGVDVDLNNVGIDIRVNNIPIYYDDEKGQMTAELPSPESIINGFNSLSLKAFLPYDGDVISGSFEEGAYASAILFKQRMDNNSPKVPLLKARVNLTGDKYEVEIEDYISKKSKKFTKPMTQNKTILVEVKADIKSSFPQWAWQKGKIITTEDKSSLLQAYKRIHNALLEKNLSKLKDLYSVRASEIAIAYYLPDIEAGFKKLSVGADMNDPELELYDFNSENMEIEILANGKLARIVDADYDQPILYFNSQSQLLHLYKFMFYLNDENKWIMVR